MSSSRRSLWSTGAAVAIAVAAAAPSFAQEAPRQRSHERFTSAEPGGSTGTRESIDYLAAAPNGKPHSVTSVTTRLAEGTRVDTSVPGRCTANQLELMLVGPGACPDDSRVGGGNLAVDTGLPGGPVPRVLLNTVTFFNADGRLILFTESTNTPGPPIRTATVGTWRGSELRFEVPPIPGVPPPEPFIAIKTVRVGLNPVDRDGRSFITTPATCPPSGAWRNTETFTYSDGVSQSVVTRAPCAGLREAKQRLGLRISMRGVPRRSCVRSDFRLRVRIAAEGLRRARVGLDRRTLRTTRRTRFSVRVPAAGLRAGRHRVTVSATDGAGNRARRVARFRRCRR